METPPQVDPSLEKDAVEEQEKPKRTKEEILKEIQDRIDKVAFVEVGALAEAEARDTGGERMTEAREKTKGLKNVFKRIWKHNIMRNYYDHVETEKVRDEIKESGNIYAGDGRDQKYHDDAMAAIVSKFTSEYDGLIRKDAGESKEILSEDKEGVTEVKDLTKKLILDYASGKIDNDTYNSERDRVLSKVTGVSKEIVGEGVMYADNMKDVSEQVKQALDHGLSMEEIEESLDFSVTVGKAESGVKTEARSNKLEKLVKKISENKFGALVANETTIALAVYGASALASTMLKGAAKNTAKMVGFVGGAAAAGVIAGIKEASAVEDDWKLRSRSGAKGQESIPGKDSPRNKEMEKALNETVAANELTIGLLSEIYVDGDPERGVKEFKSKEEAHKAMAAIANIESRISLSNREKVDLIAYSSPTSVEVERANLEIEQARAKANLKKRVESDPFLKEALQGEDIDRMIGSMTVNGEKVLHKEMDKRADVFRKIKTKRVAKAALKGAVSAVVIGAAFQELAAFRNDDVDGLAETLIKGESAEAKTTTALQGFREWFSGQSGVPASEIAKSAIFEDVEIDGHNLRFPQGTSIAPNPDGTVDIVSGGNAIAKNIEFTFNPDGTVSDQTKAALENAGILNSGETLKNIIQDQEVTISPKDLVEDRDDLTKVARDFWHDNDTEGFFDKNEQLLHFGGESGTGIDADGNYVFNVSNMASEGSYHGADSMDVPDLVEKGGVMKMLFSMSRDTQNTVFEVDIDANGNAIIDPDSEIGKLFFQTVDGEAVFKGRFAEVAREMGSIDGVNHYQIGATFEGAGLDDIDVIIPKPTPGMVDDFVFDMDRPWEFPPVIPFVGRFPLEPVGDKVKKSPDDPKPTPPGPVDPVPPGPVDPVPPGPDDPTPAPVDPVGPENNIDIPKNWPMGVEEVISMKEYNSMKDDLILINTMIQSHDGILSLDRDQLKSKHAKERYDDLKDIGPGIPITWNKEELRIIGDEIEQMLSGSELVEQDYDAFVGKLRTVHDLKQKYEDYIYRLQQGKYEDVREKARTIQALNMIMSEVDYLRDKNRTSKTQEQFLNSTKDGGVLEGVGKMKVGTPEYYMDNYVSQYKDRLDKAALAYDEDPTDARKATLEKREAEYRGLQASLDELVRGKDFKKKDLEKQYVIRNPFKISDPEWKAFKESNIVSEGRMNMISTKVKERKRLSEKEQEIYDSRDEDIDSSVDAAGGVDEFTTQMTNSPGGVPEALRNGAIEGIKNGTYFTESEEEAKSLISDSLLNDEYEYYASRDLSVGSGFADIFKFKKKGETAPLSDSEKESKAPESVLVGPDGSPIEFEGQDDGSGPEIISTKESGNIETAAEEVGLDDLLSVPMKDLDSDKINLLKSIKGDFERNADQDAVAEVKETGRVITELLKTPITSPFDLNKLKSPYAKILFREAEYALPTLGPRTQLEWASKRIESFIKTK